MVFIQILMLPLPTFLLEFLIWLKHCIAIKPKDNEIFAIAEDIYDQIKRKGLCKEYQISMQLQKIVYKLLHSIYWI